MNTGQHVGTHIGARVNQTQKTDVRVGTRAIADEKRFGEILITNDLDQEDEVSDLGDEANAPEEFVGNEPDLGLGDQDLTGVSADSGAGSNFEPQEREDLGDSDGYFAENDSSDLFDQKRAGKLPLISELPRQARPIVRFAIDAEYRVHALDLLYDPHFELRRLLASAVANHLKQHNVVLKDPGDWSGIPAIGGDDELVMLVVNACSEKTDAEKLIDLRSTSRRAQKAVQAIRKKMQTAKKAGQYLDSNGEDEERLRSSNSELQRKLDDHLKSLPPEIQEFCKRLKQYGAHLKAMGICLSNGDVVTVETIVRPAGQGVLKQVTRAGKIRNQWAHDSKIRAETMGQNEQAVFSESQRKAKYRKKGS